MSRTRPPLLLRLAVVVGAFTLVLGVVGVVLLALRSDVDASAAGPGLAEHVRVVGPARGASLVVSVQWEEDSIVHNETALGLPVVDIGGGRARHTFRLPPDLVGRRIAIEVRDADTAQVLGSREVVLGAGEEVRLDIEQAADR